MWIRAAGDSSFLVCVVTPTCCNRANTSHQPLICAYESPSLSTTYVPHRDIYAVVRSDWHYVHHRSGGRARSQVCSWTEGPVAAPLPGLHSVPGASCQGRTHLGEEAAAPHVRGSLVGGGTPVGRAPHRAPSLVQDHHQPRAAMAPVHQSASHVVWDFRADVSSSLHNSVFQTFRRHIFR